MQVQVSGQQIDIGASLKGYVEERACSTVEKYFEDAISFHVNFSKQVHLFYCDIILNDGTGRNVVRSKAEADEIYHCFDLALAKLEKQLRRYKSKIQDKQSRMKTADAIEKIAATKYVISSTESDLEAENPVIIAEKPHEILSLSVSDAVMAMDLENLPALLFKNAKTGRINVVYYRKDGNISWVDTKA